MIMLMSSLALLINTTVTHYPGINYFPNNALPIEAILLLLIIGNYLQFGADAQLTLIFIEINYWYMSMALVVLATTAAQYTPFKPIDALLTQWSGEMLFSTALIQWVQHHHPLQYSLGWVYDSLNYQLIALPLLLILFRKTHLIREYYLLLLANTLLGFSVYYFFPTTAPASLWPNVTFSSAQYATGLKFYQIHHFSNLDLLFLEY